MQRNRIYRTLDSRSLTISGNEFKVSVNSVIIPPMA